MSVLVHAGSGPYLIGMDTQPPETTTDDMPEKPKAPPPKLPKEIGGVEGPEPTRYGDWQHKGRVSDF